MPPTLQRAVRLPASLPPQLARYHLAPRAYLPRLRGGSPVAYVNIEGIEAPVVWAIGISALLCTTFAVFERTVEEARERVPDFIRPTVDCLLAEMATLGFIGLLVQADVFGLQRGEFAKLSETYLGESMLGYDIFEEVHQTLFRAAVAYFTSCAVVVFGAAQAIELRFKRMDANQDGILTLDEYLAAENDVYTPFEDLELRASLRGRSVCDDEGEDVCKTVDVGGITCANLKDITAKIFEELIELDPLTIFLITTPIEIPALVLELTTDEASRQIAGASVHVPPYLVALCCTVLALSFTLFRNRVVDIGESLRGNSFVLFSIKELTLVAAYILAASTPVLMTDLLALRTSSVSSEVFNETAALTFGVILMFMVLARMNAVLLEYIGAASFQYLRLAAQASAGEDGFSQETEKP